MSRSDTHSLIDRLFLAHRTLQSARIPVAASSLQSLLGNCSRKQLTKTITHLRDVLRAPLLYDDHAKGWYYDRHAPTFELPGLWFTATELHALLAAEQLLARADPGVLAGAIAPLRTRIATLLQQGSRHPALRLESVRITSPMLRRTDRQVFAVVAEATLTGRRLRMHYRPRSRASSENREVSPLRLDHYRGNWYLRAWCHTRNDWRRFALERIEQPEVAVAAAEFPQAEPDATAFGVFDRGARQRAVLRFSAERARWIADEEWHPDQRQRWLDDGRFELEVPYGDATELVLDILRYGPDVEVAAPYSLRKLVQSRLSQALAQYHV